MRALMHKFESKNIDKYIEHDFDRDIWCVLGFPIDNIGLHETVDLIQYYIDNNKQCVLSTVNVNFTDCAFKSTEFRKAVANSDIGVIDGFPVMLASKFLKFPIKERTSGSVLIKHILDKGQKPYSLFWFGSEEGTAKKAFENTNSMDTKCNAVGYYYPGHGTIEEMSTTKEHSLINNSHPDLLLLALSAKKGVIWIEKNRKKLETFVLSHIGAVMDFVAGEEKESPVVVRKLGIEWFWKSLLCPSLFKRFFKEGLTLLHIVFKYLIPYKLLLINSKKDFKEQDISTISINKENDELLHIDLNGSCTVDSIDIFKTGFKKAILLRKNLVINFDKVVYLDSAFIGLLLLVYKYQKLDQKKLELINLNKKVSKIFRYNLVSDLFNFND